MSYEDIFRYCLIGLSVLLTVVNMLTRGRFKSIQKELDNLINYLSAEQRINGDVKPVSTKFSNLIPQFRLNKATGMLEEADPLDITALTNSSRNVELKSLLERLESGTAELTQQVKTQYNDYSDTLDELANALDVAEEYRSKFGLGEDVSVSDIFARIEQERDKLKDTLDTIAKAQTKSDVEVVDNVEKTAHVETQE